ncbi:solute carrier family 22 member 11 isoform X2 [Choloepus didactylus]|uniref:solute carrier family 22 member 11 isoform X2 n=1 Tax=Choloepus didactylus TaxID=27675 RepID=UPI00189DA49F|nr:solute carrier family 22 member 11 isoform X2 [Choloepus didactylus]
MAFSELLERAGGIGRFHVLQTVTILFVIILLPSHMLLENFSAAVPNHRCRAPLLDNSTAQASVPGALGPEALLEVSIPPSPDQRPHRCLRFRHPQWQLLGPNASATNWSEAATEPCMDGWVYDRSTFTSTTVTEDRLDRERGRGHTRAMDVWCSAGAPGRITSGSAASSPFTPSPVRGAALSPHHLGENTDSATGSSKLTQLVIMGPGVQLAGPQAHGPVHLPGRGPGGIRCVGSPLLPVGAEADPELVLPAGGRGQHGRVLCPELPRLLRSPVRECCRRRRHQLGLQRALGRVDHHGQEGGHHGGAGMLLQHRPNDHSRPGLRPAGLALPPDGRVGALLCLLPGILVAAGIRPVADYYGQTRPRASGTQKGGEDKWPQGSQKDTDHRASSMEEELATAKTQQSVLDLFRVPVLRWRTYSLLVVSFVQFMSYYGLVLDLQSLGRDIFLLQVLFGAVDFVGRFFVPLGLRCFGRRKAIASALFLSGVSILANVLVPEDLQTLRVAFAVLGKGGFAINFTCYSVYLSEVFPTSLRVTANGLLHSVGRAGAVLGPLIRLTGQTLPLLPSLIYGILPITSGFIVLLFLPETQGLPLPDTIQDMENQSGPAWGHRREVVITESTWL